MLHLQIITPDRIAYSESIDRVSVPALTGQLTILPKHTRLFSQLTSGEVKLLTGDEEYVLAIGSGFVEVEKNTTTILVTAAVHAKELNEHDIQRAQEEARKILAQKPQGELLETAQASFRRSILELKVLRRHKRLPRL